MTKEKLKEIEEKVVAELGNEFDIDMLSVTLKDMNIPVTDAFICAGCWLGDVFDTFEYKGNTFETLSPEDQALIFNTVKELS